MKFGRVRSGDRILHVRVLNETLEVLDGNPLTGEVHPTGETLDPREVELLPPTRPRQIFAVGLNLAEHIGETGSLKDIPETPVIFTKPLSSLLGHRQPIRIPTGVGRVDYEGELVAVIGSPVSRPLSVEEASQTIAGYTLGNDVTARDLQKREPQWTRAKGYRTFAPVGPFWVATREIREPWEVFLRGQPVQKGNPDQWIRTPAQLVAWISTFADLYPGDLIFLGTPAGVGPLQPGDRISLHHPWIGTLENPVEADA